MLITESKQLGLNHVIFNNTSQSYLLDHFHKVSESRRYNPRGSSEKFVVPRVSSQASTTFCFNGIKDWNGLSSDIKGMEISTGSKLQLKDIRSLKCILRKVIYFATTRLFYIWARSCEYVSYGICEQQRCRSAFVVRCLDSIMPLVSISEISRL